ncbi:MAG: hypothetical protein ACREQ7_01045 [Candidatus Binatia bacterium]
MEEERRVKVSDRRLSTKDMAAAAERHVHRDETPETKTIERDEELAGGQARPQDGEELSPLLSHQEEGDLRSRWNTIQTGFVDEPRRAVEQADELVAEIMQRLAQSFSDQRNNLETQWEHSEKISTEELRVAFRRYRSFFDRLLSI